MESAGFSIEICEWGCQIFANITSLAMTTQNTEMMADFLDAGTCEALIAAMTMHSSVSDVVTSQSCAAIANLCWSSMEMREHLGDLGCCELVVYATLYHIGDPRVSEYGSSALIHLANNNPLNSYRLAEAGAVDLIAQLGNFGFNLRHPQCVVVATNTCIAFAELAEAINSTALEEVGACELVLNLLKVLKKCSSTFPLMLSLGAPQE